MSSMDPSLITPLLKAVAETLENLAFLTVTAADAKAFEATGECLCATLPVVNPVNGEFQLEMPRELLERIAETVYFIPSEELEDATLLDTLCEILNTIGGRIMSLLLPEDQVFNLGLPSLHEDIPTSMPDENYFFEVEGLAFSLSISGPSLLQLL